VLRPHREQAQHEDGSRPRDHDLLETIGSRKERVDLAKVFAPSYPLENDPSADQSSDEHEGGDDVEEDDEDRERNVHLGPVH
jgi:hypothetical protein